MLIVIISVIATVLGIGLLIYYNTKSFYSSDWSLYAGVPCALIGIIALIVSLIACISTQYTKEINYEDTVERREMLVYRLEHQDDNLVGGELLYQEIREFNEDLRHCKKFHDNPWVNWFINEKNATLDYIDYKVGDTSE